MISLHVSNTNINHDGRIRKEMEALRKSNLNLAVQGVGAHQEEDASRIDYGLEEEGIATIILSSEKIKILPRPLKYVLMLIEFTIRVVKHGASIRPDIVHCHDTFALPAGVILKIFGAKVIYDAHELESNKNGQSRALSIFTLLIEKICWRYINGFITVSNKILEWYQGQFAKKPSITLLNAPKKHIASGTTPESNYLRVKYNILDEANVYVYVGILSSGRGIEKILRVFSSPGSSHVVFLGYGPMLVEMQEYEKKFSRIHVHPPVAHDDVVNTILSANFGFCLIENSSLSDYLCLPNKLFEYAQANVVVVGSDFPEICEVLDKYKLGLTVKNDETEISNLVNSLDRDGYCCNSRLLDELTWESQENHLRSFYELIIGEH